MSEPKFEYRVVWEMWRSKNEWINAVSEAPDEKTALERAKELSGMVAFERNVRIEGA